MRHGACILAVYGLLGVLAACGGRSGTVLSGEPAPVLPDGGSDDGEIPGTDGPRTRDGRPAEGGWIKDLLVRIDRHRADSCLPIPASQVAGSYSGTWKGSLGCPGGATISVNGTLTFTLQATSGTAFSVSGSMNGMAMGFVPFTSSIKGAMGCTALSATLPDIEIGKGTPYHYRGSGSLLGTFSLSRSTGQRGFPSGSWRGSDVFDQCDGTGTWSATAP